MTDRRTQPYKGKPSGPPVAHLHKASELQTLLLPVAAGERRGRRAGTAWMMRCRIGGPAWSSSRREAEEETPAGPGGDPTGALILSTVAKGLLVCGIIHQCGHFR